MTTVRHPAPFSEVLLDYMVEMLKERVGNNETIYDPMAGSGERLSDLAEMLGCQMAGSEIEPEFIVDQRVVARDCLDHEGRYPVVVTSPAYGNRFADQYLGTPAEQMERATSGKTPRRRSYAIALGRRCSDGSGAALQWGDNYRGLHYRILRHVVHSNMTDDGVFLLNVASHFRASEYQHVAEWFLSVCVSHLGLPLIDYRFVPTPGFRDGQNREARVGGEHLFLFAKGTAT
jgi:hypothetical protein